MELLLAVINFGIYSGIEKTGINKAGPFPTAIFP